VLAAGAGTRFGGPKALAREPDGTPWLVRADRMLRAAGCADVLIALGAGGAEATGLVPAGTAVVAVPDWAEGLSATLRAGLDAAAAAHADAVLIVPVDTPDAPGEAGRRVVAAVGSDVRRGLAQAMYSGAPGHPVLIGSGHFADVTATLAGDRGAGPYLRAHGAIGVECGDLWTGADVDVR